MTAAVTAAKWITLGVAIFFILATLIALVPTTKWWVRDLGFPRVQIALLLLGSSIPLLIFFRGEGVFVVVVSVIAILCAVYQFVEIFPYTPIARRQSLPPASGDTNLRVRLMVTNVLMENRNVNELLGIVDDVRPDVLLAVETDEWWSEQLSVLEEEYPYKVLHPRDNTYGIVLYSRFELMDPEVRFLVQDTIPSVITRVRLRSGDEIALYCLHPCPPIPNIDSDERDAELLIAGRMIRKSGEPAIALGDLNDVAWSHTTRLFQRISGMLDPRIGRGFFNTFHAKYWFLRYPLDHIFHTEHFRLVSMTRLPGFGSDHFPICAEFSYEPERGGVQEKPEAEPKDQEEAEEAIRRVTTPERKEGIVVGT